MRLSSRATLLRGWACPNRPAPDWRRGDSVMNLAQLHKGYAELGESLSSVPIQLTLLRSS